MFYVGSTVRLTCRFRDLLSKLDFDPNGIKVLVKIIDGEAEDFTYGTDIEVVRDSLGHFHYDFVPDAAGTYEFRWEGSGARPVASEARFKVHASAF